MMGTAIAFLMSKGLSQNVARVILYAGGLLLLLGACGGLLAAYNHHIIGVHEAKQVAATAKADLKANDHASEQRRTDDSRSTQDDTQIKEAVNEAGNDPAARRAAYYRCVREQQSTRRAGKPSAAC